MIIDVNAAVAELVPAYIERRQTEIQILEDALEAGDLPVIQRVAHNMKGTGAGYGFPDITQGAARAETLIKTTSEIQAIKAAVDDLIELIRKTDGYDPTKETHGRQTAPHRG